MEVPFDAVTDLRSTWLYHLTIPLRVAVEAGSASPDDGVGVYGLGYGRTRRVSDVSLVALRIREDAVSEGQESLRLRLSAETDPAKSLRVGEPVRNALTRPEIEVVILADPDRCSVSS